MPVVAPSVHPVVAPSNADPELNGDIDIDVEATDDLPLESLSNTMDQHDGNAQAVTTPTLVSSPPEGDTVNGTLNDAEAARYERFCALAKQVIPRADKWARIYREPINVFGADELPFQEKKLICCEFWNSLMMPSIGAMATILASTFTLYTFIVSIQADRLVSSDSFNWSIGALLVGPLIVGMLSMRVVIDHPARLLLYFRLWEQKVVINYKERGLKDQSTQRELAVIVVTIIGYIIYGCRSEYVDEKWTYIVVVVQTFGTMGLSIYKIYSVDLYLQSVNGVFKHYLSCDANEKRDVNPYNYRERAHKAIKQVEFVREFNLKFR